MPNEEFIFKVNTLAGARYPILKELENEFRIEEDYLTIYRHSKLVSALLTGLSYVDDWFYRTRSKGMTIEKPPIYILGFWRSGTTFLHNLLCSLEDTSYPTTYHTVFPNNLFFLRKVIKSITQFYLPERRIRDRVKMHVDLPQEEDFGLGNDIGYSFYYWFHFPSQHRKVSDRYLAPDRRDRRLYESVKKGYIRFVKRSILHVGGAQYVAKNPPNLARIPFLLDVFPEARFIYIQRNTYEVLQSSFKFFRGFLKTLQLQDVDDSELWNFVFGTYRTLYTSYRDHQHKIPEGKLYRISYEDLMAGPEPEFLKLRDRFLPEMTMDQSLFSRHIKEHRNHHPNTYHFSREYLDRVNHEVGDLIEEMGYELM